MTGWRDTIDPPCTCGPRDGDDECSRVEECYEAWLATRQDPTEKVRGSDLQVEVFRVPTPLPGPCVVRITHLPTGIVVTSQEHTSSIAAKQDALRQLRQDLGGAQ